MKISHIIISCITCSIFLLTACEEGFSFSSKTIDGTWVCNEIHDDLDERSYYVDIEYNQSDSSKIYIYNFLGLSNDITSNIKANATVQGNQINIQKQVIDNHEVEGSGEISDNYKTITLSYTDNLYGTPWNVEATYTFYE